MNHFFTLRLKNMLAFLCIAFITAIVGVTGYVGMNKLESKFNVVIESASLIQSAINMKLVVSQATYGIHETNTHIADASIASGNIANDISSVNETSTRVADSSQKVTDNVLKLTNFAGQLRQVLANFKV